MSLFRSRRFWIATAFVLLLLAGAGGIVWWQFTDYPTVVKAEGACPVEPASAAEDAGMHAPFDSLLRAYVNNGGFVDYRCFATHRGTLQSYLQTLATADVGAMSRDDQLAFWINAYNAWTVEVILVRYPAIDSIREINAPMGPWKSETMTVAGRELTLDAIEHEILRTDFDEPRIHFAIVCASLGCPELRAEAYVARRLESQLASQTERFLADTTKGARLEGSTLHLSSVFDWFKEDFGATRAGRIATIRQWLPTDTATAVETVGDDLQLAYLHWDWALNGN